MSGVRVPPVAKAAVAQLVERLRAVSNCSPAWFGWRQLRLLHCKRKPVANCSPIGFDGLGGVEMGYFGSQ